MSEEVPIINCAYSSESALYMAYMPFLTNGGLFVRTLQSYPIGSKVVLLVNLPNEAEAYRVNAKVAWVTPRGSQGSKPPGLGFQFIDPDSRNFANKIETHLAGMLKSSQMTDTM
ncbi:type 4 fimbrial biogenesis protein PilZ [Legionella birminghamensis]|uniref:Type 4 fimbrial biogenesis protein PilZ n=1 Tax=Legionella birminghamensis TaxID=28083 RepID=A0A378I914_9GAMM|nr:PilZ domain-containing protein [Legionella birminghamensis]KTC74387.1 type 4 fimbrial biogenesis protein PilZ [Legionella birminghamensis]STX31698.1 type 4 fimbrial biogenesis protein PilZ [Legionella birminghamensis]